MKVLVIGANGRVGSLLSEKLAVQHQVVAGSRHSLPTNMYSNVEHANLDLLNDVDTIEKTMSGIDAVYFVSGSRGKNLLQIRLTWGNKNHASCRKGWGKPLHIA